MSVAGGISMKLATNIQHMTGHHEKGFQGQASQVQRSKVKVMIKPINV